MLWVMVFRVSLGFLGWGWFRFWFWVSGLSGVVLGGFGFGFSGCREVGFGYFAILEFDDDFVGVLSRFRWVCALQVHAFSCFV